MWSCIELSVFLIALCCVALTATIIWEKASATVFRRQMKDTLMPLLPPLLARVIVGLDAPGLHEQIVRNVMQGPSAVPADAQVREMIERDIIVVRHPRNSTGPASASGEE